MTRCMTSGLMGPSQTIEWGTPDEIFRPLDREFGFILDVCASDGMQKCEHYFNPAQNGLEQAWGEGPCWLNPPYGRDIKQWVKKAALSGAVVVALLPARTDTKWYKEWVEPYASEIRLIPGRVKFKGASSGAPFPSLIAIYGTPRTPRYGVFTKRA